MFATFVKRTDHGTRYPTIAISTSTFSFPLSPHMTSSFSHFFPRPFAVPSRFTLSPRFSQSFSLSLVVLPLSSSLSFAGRRRPDERDNSSSIRLSVTTPFAFLPITLFFHSYLPFAKTSVCYRRRGSKCSLQLQSGAMHSRDASTRRSRSLIRTQGDGDKEFVSTSFLSSLAAFYALYLPNGFNYARLAFHRSLFVK